MSWLLLLSLWGPLSFYLWNRWRYACVGHALWFLVSETVVLLVGCVNTHVLMEGTLRYEKHRNDVGIGVATWHDVEERGWAPHVLIVIPTYHEGVAVLEKTLTAVSQIDYPRDKITVVIGDDGKDDTVRDFMNGSFPMFRYHRRMLLQGHAKAGNINDILFASDDPTVNYLDHLLYEGDYVLVLDCDMVPEPDILLRLLPLFWDGSRLDERCAFVQSPQAFYNIRGYDWLGQHYFFFYQVVQKAYSGFSLGVPCCGTNVVFDRKKLMDIGGFQYGSVTEDFNTSLLMHSQGLVSRYYTGRTACGMSPLSLVEFYHQRKRWSIGGLQIVFSRQYGSRVRRLPLVYQWVYTFSGVSPLVSVFLLVLMMGPLLDLFCPHLFLCDLGAHRYLVSFAPYALVYAACLVYLHRFLPWTIMVTSLQETLFMVFFSVRFVASFVRKTIGFQKITFKTTKKSMAAARPAQREHVTTLVLLMPYLIFFAGAAAALGMTKKRGTAVCVDAFWLVTMMLQIAPVPLYVIQEGLERCRTKTVGVSAH